MSRASRTGSRLAHLASCVGSGGRQTDGHERRPRPPRRRRVHGHEDDVAAGQGERVAGARSRSVPAPSSTISDGEALGRAPRSGPAPPARRGRSVGGRGQERGRRRAGRGPASAPASQAERSTQTERGGASRARAWPRPPRRSPKPAHSSRIDRSVGSCSSTISSPSPIACGVPAGTKIASPGRDRDAVQRAEQRVAVLVARPSRRACPRRSRRGSRRAPRCRRVRRRRRPTPRSCRTGSRGAPRRTRRPDGRGRAAARRRRAASRAAPGPGRSARRARARARPRRARRSAARSSPPPGEPAQPERALTEDGRGRADPFLGDALALRSRRPGAP